MVYNTWSYPEEDVFPFEFGSCFRFVYNAGIYNNFVLHDGHHVRLAHSAINSLLCLGWETEDVKQ